MVDHFLNNTKKGGGMVANISTSIQLYDRVSAPINNMLGALNNIIYAFESVDDSMNGAFNTADIDVARNHVQQATAQVVALGQEIEENEQNQEQFNNEVKNGASDMDGLTNKVMGLVGAYASLQGIQKLINLSDEYTQTSARLNMINDGLQTQEELQDKIYASAQRSRASYTATADTVAKLSLNAGDAFGSNDETILFAENLNKLFAIAGTEQASVASASLQLTQALGSGVLRGEEFNAVFEAAPNIMQTVADSMGVPIGSLRGMAAEGKITADIVKNALLGATDDINQQFESMPITWGQVWTGVMNELYMASVPVLEFISMLAQNWSILEPIVIGVATAIGIYTAALLIYNTVKGVSALMESVHAASTMMSTGATFAATAAQYGFNAALLACPLTWILLIIIAVIAAIYAVIAVINKVTGSTVSATGVIVGVLMTAVAFIWNIVVGLLNGIIQLVYTIFVEPFLGIIEWILNVCNGGFDSFGAAVANLIGQIIGWFLSLGQVVTRIIDAIFGTNWTGGLESLKSKVTAWGKNEDAITLDRSTDSMMLNRWEYGDAYDTGYNWGAEIGDSVSNAFDDNGMAENLATTAENTGKSSDSLDITSEDLKYLKDIAERDVINRFTTAEIKVDMKNTNTINNNMDLDGVVDYLASGVNEAMEKAAEGVHI